MRTVLESSRSQRSLNQHAQEETSRTCNMSCQVVLREPTQIQMQPQGHYGLSSAPTPWHRIGLAKAARSMSIPMVRKEADLDSCHLSKSPRDARRQ